jgi:ABC transporter/Four helical bundle domain
MHAMHACVQMVADHMTEELVELRAAGKSNTLFEEALQYVATMCTTLMDEHCFDSKQWALCFTPYIGPFVGERAAEACLCALQLYPAPPCMRIMSTPHLWRLCSTPCRACGSHAQHACAACVCRAVMRRCQRDVRMLEGVPEDDEEGVDLCDCDFSLAYGGRILLSNAKLRLKQGGRYGLCGPNGAGKTTLMKAIANGQVRWEGCGCMRCMHVGAVAGAAWLSSAGGSLAHGKRQLRTTATSCCRRGHCQQHRNLQVDGFPPPEEVLTVYVAHDIQAQEEDPLVLDYLAEDAQIKTKGLSRARCLSALEEIGFDESRLSLNVSALSGAPTHTHVVHACAARARTAAACRRVEDEARAGSCDAAGGGAAAARRANQPHGQGQRRVATGVPALVRHDTHHGVA